MYFGLEEKVQFTRLAHFYMGYAAMNCYNLNTIRQYNIYIYCKLIFIVKNVFYFIIYNVGGEVVEVIMHM